jgi:chromosome segregation ATPase|tara:strand:+ start:833 stop:1027 length:195 start_codon:yes stop_codon:yes gene_type:complete
MQYQKRHQLLEIISEYKSDHTALKKQIDDLKQQLDEAQSRIKRLLIRCEQFAEDNNTENNNKES